MFSSVVSTGRNEDPCLRVYSELGGRAAEKDFWKSDVPVMVNTPSGPQPFAFGFDAELWHLSDVLRLINSDPASRAKMDQVLRDNRRLHVPRAKMKRMLGLDTDAELEEAIRDSRKGARTLTFADIKRGYLDDLTHGSKEKTQFAKPLTPLVASALENRGIPVTAKHEVSSGDVTQGILGDGEAVELIQKGSSQSPKEFRDLIKRFLYGEVGYPETHFHVSVPKDAATWQQMYLAARALEMKITMEELLDDVEYDGVLYPYDASALAEPITTEVYNVPEPWTGVDRGIVRLEMNRWETPVKAHDVEIRMWLDADHGLANMKFFMNLVQNADRLRDTSAFTGKYVEKLAPANLNASLRYMAFVLKDRIPADKQHVLPKLEEFAAKIERNGKLGKAFRSEIRQYVSENDLLKYLSLETFLEPRAR